MPLPGWVVVAPFVWVTVLALEGGWVAQRVAELQRGRRRTRVRVGAAVALALGAAAAGVPVSPALEPALAARAALAALALAGAWLAAWLRLRLRHDGTTASADDDAGAPLSLGPSAVAVGVLAAGAGLAVLWAGARLSGDPYASLATSPRDPALLLAVAQHALAAEEPAIARARAALAEQAGADPTDTARLTADAWAAEGRCRQAWRAIERASRLAAARDGALRLREGVVGPTLARRCPGGPAPQNPIGGPGSGAR